MATNREKIIAVDLTTNTRRIGHLMWVQENALQGKDHDGNPLLNQTIIATGDLPGDETPPSLTEADVVIQCKANRDLIVERTRDIETVLAKVDKEFLDSGFTGIGVTKFHVVADVADAKSIAENSKAAINAAQGLPDFLPVVPAFENFRPQLNNPVRINDLPGQVHDICMLNDLLDAMSYLLVNRNSHTGESVFRNVKDIKIWVNARIGTAHRVLARLSNKPDVRNMKAVLTYVEQNLDSCISLMDLAILSDYIDSHVPKLILSRRWWAL